MRILQVAPLVAPLDDRAVQLGGAQVVITELARRLASAGHEVTLAAADGSFVEGVRLAPLGIDATRLERADLGMRGGARPDDAAERDAFARVRAWLDAHVADIDVV
ncbi:MAG TPA: glycosyltransferase, partial [Candidatus Limnocylindria bacterium]|nr:glycosyltransferase [Candidatus Limnocylindria bacterium]